MATRLPPAVQQLVNAISAETSISNEDLVSAITGGHARGLRPLRAILGAGVGFDILERAAWAHRGYEFVGIDTIDSETTEQISVSLCRRLRVVPLRADENGKVTVAFADPDDIEAMDVMRRRFGANLRVAVADAGQINNALIALEHAESFAADPDAANEEEELTSGDVQASDEGRVAQMATALVQRAISSRASDIHLEPSGRDMIVRYRIDGVLTRITSYPMSEARALVNRFKIIGGLDVGERRVPQDGRFAMKVEGRSVDMRLATIPTVWGYEGAVMRILDRSDDIATLEALGLEPHEYNLLCRLVDAPHGAVIATGPTGSGKPVWVEEPVLMADGSYKRMGDLAVNDLVITHRGRARAVEATYDQGVLPVFEITTQSGRTVHAAHDHRFLTTRGWLHVDELAVGDHLANVPDPKIFATSMRTNTEFRLAGYFVGDGGVTSGDRLRGQGTVPGSSDRGRRGGTILNARFTNGDPAVHDDFRLCAEKMGWAVKPVSGDKYSVGVSNGVRQWLRDTGLAGKGAHTKRVPDFVFNGTREQVGEFLAGYLDTDGCVSKWPDRPAGQIEFYSVNKDLLDDVQRLCLRVGIQVRVRPKNGRYKGQVHESWRLTVSSRDDAAKFADLVKPVGARGDRMKGWAGERTEFDRDLLADRIVSIEPAGDLPCCCITVEEDHSYTVNDLVTHNTTTLYAVLNRVATPDVKVCTVEDPVEMRIPGILQVQVNNKQGLGFDRALKSFLRCDPDVVMVGEIRDTETAKIGIEAALTGHVVLATLHANRAPAGPARLLEMGVEGYLASSALRGMISQRLVRRLCEHCRVPIDMNPKLAAVGWPGDVPDVIYGPRIEGCSRCSLGYRGRLLLCEVMEVTETLGSLIVQEVQSTKLEAAAIEEGFRPMRTSGLEKVAEGITSMDEMLKVTD